MTILAKSNKTKNMKNVLITGASSGIGLELAKIFAQNGYNLVLVARSFDKLQKLAEELTSNYKVHVHVLPKDLSNQSAAYEVFETVKNLNFDVDILVNNAGFGDLDYFSIEKLEKYEKMISLNVLSTTQLSVLFGEQMKAKRRGIILNVSSIAAYAPLPYFTVYAATKSYILNFTRALSYELKPYGIKVKALCPGPTLTNFIETAEMTNLKNTIFDKKLGAMTAQKVAQITFKKLFSNKGVIIPGVINKLQVATSYILPKCFLSILYGAYLKRMIKK